MAIVITKQPSNFYAVAGDAVTFSVEATGVVSYQWQVQSESGYWNNLTWPGNTTATMTRELNVNNITYSYRCKLTGTDGKVVYTNVVKLVKILISKQPTSKAGFVDSEVTFTIETAGNDLTYQWQYTSDGKSWLNSPLTGADTETLKVPVTESRNGMGYRCKITDVDGNVAYTTVATLTVLDMTSANGLVSSETMTAIGDLIREKEGTSDRIIPANMEPRLRAIIENAIENANVEFQTLEGTISGIGGSSSSPTTHVSLGTILPESDTYVFIMYKTAYASSVGTWGLAVLVEWKLGQEFKSFETQFITTPAFSSSLYDITALYPTDSGDATQVITNTGWGKAVNLTWRYMYV